MRENSKTVSGMAREPISDLTEAWAMMENLRTIFQIELIGTTY